MRCLYFGLSLLVLFCTTGGYSQSVGIGTISPNENAALHIVSPSNNQGLLMPQLTSPQRFAIPAQSPRDDGLLVFDIDERTFFYWKNGSWQNAFSSGSVFQNLSYDPLTKQLSLSDGGSTDLSSLFQDASDILISAISGITATNVQGALQELKTRIESGTDNQQLSLAGSQISLEDGGMVDLSGLLFSGNFADLAGVPVNLDTDATDDLNPGDNISELINDAGYQLSSDDGDTDPTNEAITDFRITATDIIIEENGAIAGSIPLSAFPVSTDDQLLSITGSQISLEDGGMVDLSGLLFSGNFADLAGVPVNLDTDATDDLNSGDNISELVNDAGYQLSSDDGDTDASNELIDSFTLSGNQLSITENGSLVNTLDLSGYLDNTDNQQLTLNADLLTLEDGGSPVDLSPYLDNSDNQTLSFNSLTNTLSISGGNNVDLSTLIISLGGDNQTVDQFSLSGAHQQILNILLENNNAGDLQSVDLHDVTFTGTSDLSGTLGSAVLKDGSVDSNAIQDGTIVSGDIQDNTITNDDIANSTITDGKIASLDPGKLTQAGANTDQVLKWNGSNWGPANDETGSGGMPGTLTKNYSVDPSDFSLMYENNTDLEKNMRLIFSGSNEYVTVREPAKASYLIAPVNLPDGAEITGMEIYYWDNAGQNIDVSLLRKPFGGTNQTIASWSSSGSSASVRSAPVAGLSNTLIDNANYTYRIIANLDAGNNKVDVANDAVFRIYAIKIQFTEPGNLISGPGSYQTAYVSDSQPPVGDRYIGFLWVDTSSDRIRVWNGSSWDTVANND